MLQVRLVRCKVYAWRQRRFQPQGNATVASLGGEEERAGEEARAGEEENIGEEESRDKEEVPSLEERYGCECVKLSSF